MKKLISSLLAFAMVLALFSGVVVFNTSAGNAGAEGEQATTEAYVYYPLTGFTKTTQAELDKLQGNVSYAAGDSSVAQDCSSKAELTSNPGEIKLTKNPKVNNNHQNLCTYKAADGETAAGATLNDNIWAPLDANVTYDDMDGIRFKLVDSEGEPVSACIWLRPIFTGDERGWDAYWTYEGVPEIDDDGYLCIEFARFSRHQTSGYANTSKHSVRLLMAVADAMYLRICNAPSVVYFSDLQGFKRNEKRSANMVFVDLPGFESWTDENLAANNALTGPIPDTDPVEYYPNSVLAFTTDAAVLRGDATKGLVSTSDWPRGGYTQMWSTRTERSASATQQNGHIFGEYNTVDKLQQFDGIRIGLSAPDGSDPFPYSSEWHHHTTIRTTLYGPSFQSSTATPSFRATYSYMGGQTAATADPYGVYEDGYIYIYFSDLINGGSGVWRTSGFTYFNSTAVYENLTVELVGGENNKTASTRLVLSDMQLFKKIRIDKSALKEAIKTVAGYGVSQFDEQLAAARAVYNNKEATQEEVDAQVAILNECISGFKFNYDNVKADLNDMLELADNLGFFYSTYARYEEISLADQYYTNNTNPASFENLLAEVRVVRDCVADEAMKGETCYALFKAANNAWRYNYTDPSYIALYIALSDAWDAYIADEGFDEAVAALQAAYDALVPATVKTNTANFFEGWTDTAVNDVVDANEYKDGTTLNKVDSIGDGLNRPKVYNNGDFTNNTTFEADDNFKMTADADFAGKSMGWKNMDRSGTLASGKNFGYPVMNVTGLSQSDGVRLKIEVENGSVQRLLLGLSNCTSGITREDYAMLISPDVVDEEGYINIPFSYFVNAHWASQKFTKSELEQVIVFIVEAYGVTKDTEITLSDLRGYQLTGASVDKTKLASVIAAVEALDTDKYDAEIAAAKAIYNDSFATQAEVDAQVKILNTCLDNFNNPPVNGYTYVQLNGVQNWTAEDVARLHKYGASFAISDKGLIGKATQSIELTVTDNKMRYCLSSNVDNPSGFLEKNAFSFVNAEAGYKLSDFDGIAIAFADADGNEIPISTFQPRLMRSSSDWNNFTAYQVSYSDIKAIYKNGYYHLKFSDFKNLPGDAINDICIPSILFYTGLNAGEKAYISDFCAYRYDESAAPVEQKTKREYVQLDGVQKWTANEIASLENFGASFALSDKGLIGNATQSVELTVTSAPSEKQRFCMASKTTSNGFLAKSPFAFTDTTAGYKLSDFDGIAIAFSDADGKELPITQFQCRLMRGSNDWSNYQAVEANYFDIPAVYKDGYYHLRFRDYTHLAGAIDDVYILSVLFYKSIKVGDKAYISDMLAYRDVPDLDDIVADLWEYNYTADSWTAYSEAAAVATTAAEAEAAVALLVPRKTVAVTENFFKGWTNKMVNDVVEANTHRLCDSIGDGLNRKDVWNDGDFSNNTTFDAGDGWFSMTTTVDLLNGSIGWKNMDRNKVYQPADNGAYPALTVAGLSKAEGLRLKLEVTGKAERLLIGLSNCSKFVREQYALKIKPEYVDADGYINIPFTYFEKAWWCDAFAQAELEDVIVFIVEAYGVEKDTTIKLSDVHGYKELIPATDADFEALNAAVNALKAIDLDGNKFADLYALAEGVANSNDHEEVAPVTAQLNAKLAELGDADRAPVKAKIAELDALDETDYFADERASFKQRYYGALDAEGVAALIADIQACIDQFSVPEAPEAPTAAVVEPTRVVLNTIEGAEYKCGDGEWQKSAAFADLTPNTEYTFYARYPAAGVSAASEPSEALVVKTAKETISGSVVISGDARYGATATAEVELTLTNAYDLVIEWYTTTGNKLGTGATYTFAAADIGATVLVKVTSEALEGELTSDTFGPIGKALVTVTELPTADKLPLGMTLANCILTGGVTDVEGVWAFADPDIIPEYEQSGSEFDIVFTPNEPDLYEVYTAKLAVEINAVTEAKTVINTENGGKVELSGDFHNTAVTTFEMTNIATANKTAYIDLLRAANRSGSTKNIIFMYTIDFGTPIAPYIGTLTFKAEVGESRVGETYTVWFFTKDGVTSREGVVDADGNITVEGLKF